MTCAAAVLGTHTGYVARGGTGYGLYRAAKTGEWAREVTIVSTKGPWRVPAEMGCYASAGGMRGEIASDCGGYLL